MRLVAKREQSKRGCMYCVDFQKKRLEPDQTKRVFVCIHDECPYHELDPFDRYASFLESPGEDLVKRAMVKLMLFAKGMKR